MRTFFGMLVIVLGSLVLVACGGGDDEEEPAAATEPAATTAVTSTAAATATAVSRIVTAIATPAATPAGGDDATAAPVASPVGMTAPASPAASPMATPVGTPRQGALLVPPVGDATPQASPAAGMIRLAGVVTLPGTANEAYLLSEAGCVGLGEDADLRSGRQVVVRDGTGTIVGVTTLQASGATDACSWSFAVDVPEAAFYAVAIPMKTEMVFTREEVERSGGELAIPVR